MAKEQRSEPSTEPTAVLATSTCTDEVVSGIQTPLPGGKRNSLKQEDNNNEVDNEGACEEKVAKGEEEQGHSTESTPVPAKSACNVEVASGIEAPVLTDGRESNLKQGNSNENVMKEDEEQRHSTDSTTPVLGTSTSTDEVTSRIKAKTSSPPDGKENKLKQDDNSGAKDQEETSQIPNAKNTETRSTGSESACAPTDSGKENYQASGAQTEQSLVTAKKQSHNKVEKDKEPESLGEPTSEHIADASTLEDSPLTRAENNVQPELGEAQLDVAKQAFPEENGGKFCKKEMQYAKLF